VIHFVNLYAAKLNKPNLRISPEVFNELWKYDFPGNVRELRNMTERAIMLCKSDILGIADFRVNPKKSELSVPKDEVVDLKMNEIKNIRKALQNCNYNQQAAADLLGIHRDALSRKMKKYNININKIEE
jgi:DNA-binding NtrC family response regulator